MTPHKALAPNTPRFALRAYGVELSWDDVGNIFALGHIPDTRFLAACNRLAREAGSKNLREVSANDADHDSDAVMDQWIVRRWGVLRPDPDPDAWTLDYEGVTKDTPGAIPFTCGYWA